MEEIVRDTGKAVYGEKETVPRIDGRRESIYYCFLRNWTNAEFLLNCAQCHRKEEKTVNPVDVDKNQRSIESMPLIVNPVNIPLSKKRI